jgi:NAD dependent epimerase/dehydratase family enzyme
MSWISLADEVKAIAFMLTNANIEGPVNVVAPNPVTNSQFTSILGRIIHRPTVLPLPAFAAKIILGEMADELLLSSQRCQPTKLVNNGYKFEFSKLDDALLAALQPEGSAKTAALRS